MAGRKTCFRVLACGLLFATSVYILSGMNSWKPQYLDLFYNTWRGKPGPPQYRDLVLEHFNPDTDLTIKKSEVHVGQLIRYETSLWRRAKINEDFYRLIPESSPLLGKHFRSCAIVGNSGILLGSRCGPQIDSADFVIRCNLAPIEGFETDVGTKSNFTTMNPSVLPNDYKGYDYDSIVRESFVNRLRLIGNEILFIPAFVTVNGRDDVEFANRMIVERQLPVKVTYAPRGTNAKMSLLWKKLGIEPRRLSTGAIMLALAACICDHTHMYGFYPFSQDAQGRKTKYHYYGPDSRADSIHDIPEEFRAYQMLHQRRALVLHTEPCTNQSQAETEI